MADNFDSNFTRKLMMKVADRYEANRVMSKNVDVQTFKGAFNPNTGDTIDIKRPTDYKTSRTSTGDLTGVNSDIVAGKASATVQDYRNRSPPPDIKKIRNMEANHKKD